ncbi:hypothetical protein HWV62_36781 [Athelia sp. TMB]|nr:hypothetical protein HWV62_36781 [Athelia sp. TMB]
MKKAWAKIEFLSNELGRIEMARVDLPSGPQRSELDAEYIAKARTRNSIVPISSLPIELLIEIFTIGSRVPIDPNNLHARFEVLVSHVCHLWRDTALNTPVLWTRVHRAMCQEEIGSIAAYLERSKDVPIDLAIEIASDDQDWAIEEAEYEDDSELAPVYQLLRPHIHRCEVIRIRSFSTREDRDVRRLLITAPFMPSLRYLYVSSNTAYHDEPHPWPILGAGAPSLRCVSLPICGIFFLSPPWTAVTTLHLSLALIPSSAQPALQQMLSHETPFLLHLCLEYTQDLDHTLHVNTITTLYIQLSGSVLGCRVLSMISSTSLYELTVVLESANDNVEAEFLLDSVQLLAFPSLRRLRLSPSAQGIDLITIRALSRALPSLTNITLLDLFDIPQPIRIETSRNFLRNVASSQDGRALWPHLQEMGVETTLPASDLQDFFTRRAGIGAPVPYLLLLEEDIRTQQDAMASMQPLITIGRVTQDTPFPLPEWIPPLYGNKRSA